MEIILKTLSKSYNFLKCNVCGSNFQKEITLKKHYNTKHEEQNSKVCSKTFKPAMEVLQQVANEHVERGISEGSESNAGTTSSDTLDDEAWLPQFDDHRHFIG